VRPCTLLQLVLLVTLTGCVVTYRDFPNATLESLPKDHEPKPLSYHVAPIITRESTEASESGEGVSRLNAGVLTVSGLYAAMPQVDPIGQPGYHEVARTLRASGMFSELIERPLTPDTGVYCSVNFEVRDRSAWINTYEGVHRAAVIVSMGLLLPIVTMAVFPYYAGEGGTAVVYTLYRDGRLKSEYRYPITKKGAGWIVLLPFAWLNFFTNDLKDAVRGTTLQFLIDAHRDGNL
jgi:hypothetical protein